jgi:hypothetical protein
MDAHSDRLADLDVRVLRLRPGDVLVFKAQKVLSQAQVERITEQAKALLILSGHEGVNVAVLDDKTDIEILRREDSK